MRHDMSDHFNIPVWMQAHNRQVRFERRWGAFVRAVELFAFGLAATFVAILIFLGAFSIGGSL